MDESGIEATQAMDFGDYDDDPTDDEHDDSPVAYLKVPCQKGFPGKQYPVYEGDNVIGRGEECKISIPLKALSRQHACIEVKGDSHFIYDKGSRNRTRRNKHFLAASVRYELKDKDKLIFGDVECQYQLGAAQEVDDGDETGSESMFQTAPDSEEFDATTENNDRTEAKPPDDDDYASDASSDILQPTQPSAATHSMLGHKTVNGNTTLGQSIVVKETPAATRTKRFTDDMVLPESESEAEEEGLSKPPPTLAIAADSQDVDDDDVIVKSRMMGAATQAYVCESDVTTDDEDQSFSKRSILTAPTQAFIEDDDVSTSSEASPQKKSILCAASQAFTDDSNDKVTPPPKKPGNIEPTIAYDMGVGIEPTRAYDMEEDGDEKTPLPKKPGNVEPTIAYDMGVGIEPTQAYDMEEDGDEKEETKSSGILFEPTQAYVASKTAGKDVDDDKSDTSEEFVLEGDTDAEEEEEEGGEMLAAPTLACDEPALMQMETQAVSTEEPTQLVEEKPGDDATVAVTDEPTQVFDDLKPKETKKTAVIDETVPVRELETQVFDGETRRNSGGVLEDATQVFDDVEGKVPEIQAAATQVFDECESKPGKESEILETQVFEDENQTACKGKKDDVSKQFEMETQVFDNESVDEEDEVKSFDIMAASTFAVTEDDEEDSNDKIDGVGNDDATQVFDNIGDIETVPVEPEGDRGKSKSETAETVAVSDATQIVEEKVSKPKASKKKKPFPKPDDTVALSDDATQVFDETVAVNQDQTAPINADQTALIDDSGAVDKHDNNAETVEVSDIATQVFDETVPIREEQTVVLEEVKTTIQQHDDEAEHTVEVSDIATQVFDETVPVRELETIAVEGNDKVEDEPVGQVKDIVDDSEAATQVFDVTDTVELETDNVTSKKSKAGDKKGRKKTRGNKSKVDNEIEASESVESGNESCKNSAKEEESTAVRKSGRTRGKVSVSQKETSDTLKNEPRSTRGNTSLTDASQLNKRGNRAKKTEKPNKNEEEATQIYAEADSPVKKRKIEVEPATQRYGDEGATQRYGDSDSEGPTQRYGDSDGEGVTQRYGDAGDEDLTPDLDEINNEKQEAAVVVTGTSRGRSPLKSALASPKKKASPSPKKVKFVSQDSGTGSESGESSTRSRRGLKGMQNETVSKGKASTDPQSKRSTKNRLSQVTLEHTETTNETDKIKETKRSTRGKGGKSETSVDNESTAKTEVIVKSNKRTRKSVDTELENKSETTKRKSRASLPALTEENVSESSKKKSRKFAGNIEDKSEASESGKNKTKEKEVGENQVEIETSVKKNVTKRMVKESCETLSNTGEIENTEVGVRSSQRGKTVAESKVSDDLKTTKRSIKASKSKSETCSLENPEGSKSKSANPEIVEELNIPTSRSRNRRKVETDVKEKDDILKKKKLDVVKSDGDNLESSPKITNRSRLRRNGHGDSESNEGKEVVCDIKTEQKDVKHSVKGKAAKGGKGKAAKSESDSNKKIEIETDESEVEQSDVKSENTNLKSSAKGRAGKAGNGKRNKVESETVEDVVKSEKIEVKSETNEDINIKSQRSTRGKKIVSVTVKDVKEEEISNSDILKGRARSLKRKESSSSSNDSQESQKEETPAKRQKQKGSSLTTPRQTGKQVTSVSTPKAASNKHLDTSVTHSPTLRKTTTEAGKAKVMFTGVIDEQGEKVVKELGGELVSSVTECTHLVTDQVRRTVKFLCCLSRGIPIVSTQWLASSKTSAFFVDPFLFLVRDEAAERKYKFNLELSIEKASREQVFKGFIFHVTKSVKPEPQHMSDIVKCAGAKCVNKMPSNSSTQANTVVISCTDDQALCEPAYKAGIPVVTAEFILTGILRQEVDWQSFKLVKEENGTKRPAASQGASKKRKR